MMKERYISVGLILALLLTLLAGCQGTAVPEVINAAVLAAALEKTEKLDSAHMEMSIIMDLAMEGMTMSMPITADIKATRLQSGTPTTSTNFTMSAMGQKIDVELYQEGEWSYYIASDMKFKTKTADLVSEYDYSDEADTLLQQLPEELLKDIETVKGEDGSLTVTVTIPGAIFNDLYADFLDGLDEAAAGEGTDVTITSAVVTISILDGYITVYGLDFRMEMTQGTVHATTDIKATVNYKDPGKPVEITPPAGYQSFEELDPNAIG